MRISTKRTSQVVHRDSIHQKHSILPIHLGHTGVQSSDRLPSDLAGGAYINLLEQPSITAAMLAAKQDVFAGNKMFRPALQDTDCAPA